MRRFRRKIARLKQILKKEFVVFLPSLRFFLRFPDCMARISADSLSILRHRCERELSTKTRGKKGLTFEPSVGRDRIFSHYGNDAPSWLSTSCAVEIVYNIVAAFELAITG